MLIKPKKKFWLPGIAPYYSAGALGPPVLKFVSSVVASNTGSTTTTSSANLGTTGGFASRRIIVAAGAANSFSNGTLLSATINTIPATIHTQSGAGGGGPSFAAIFSALVPLGTSPVTITLIFSNSTFAATPLAIYSVDDALLVSSTPVFPTPGVGASGTTVSTGSFTQTAGGFVIAAASVGVANTALALTGSYINDAFGSTVATVEGSFAPVVSTGSTTVTATWGSSQVSQIVAAAWR